MIKTTGAEFKRFYKDEEFWTDGFFHEQEAITIDGKDIYDDDSGINSIDLGEVDDDAKMEIEGGIIYKDDFQEVCSFESYFRKWRKQQNFVFLIVEAPKEKVDEIKAAIKAAGGKIAR